jgi:hypothetical protein
VTASRPLVWRKAIRESTLDASTKVVLYTLSTYLNGEGVAYPSREELAAGASVSITTLDRAVRRAEAAGFVDVEHTRGGGYGENKRTNHYRVTLPVTASQRRRDEWPDDEVTASNRPSHGLKQAESQSHQRSPKTLKTSKTATPNAAAASDGAAGSAEPDARDASPTEAFEAIDTLRAAASRPLPIDDCDKCGKRLPLIDGEVCVPCAAREIAAWIADDLRGELEQARAELTGGGR